jgi:hypothetical protein
MLTSSKCDSDGSCIVQCLCECYNEEIDKYNEICVCGHREHNGFCYSLCCNPIECRNYKYCNQKLPKWILNCFSGLCSDCAINLGAHKLTNTIDNCPVCFENKSMIKLKCKHLVCNDCWYIIANKKNEDYTQALATCPLCRNINDWSCSFTSNIIY